MKAKITKRRLAFLFVAATLPTALAGLALATPGFGILSAPVLARASFVDPVDIKFKVGGTDADIIHVRDAQETVMQQIVIGPGGHTGWHSHPGPAVALVKAGELTLYSSDDPTCTGRTYSAGQAFVDSGQGHVHIARNLSQTQNTEVLVTYFDVPVGGAFRIRSASTPPTRGSAVSRPTRRRSSSVLNGRRAFASTGGRGAPADRQFMRGTSAHAHSSGLE
jgi:quercetin dioxygenase-like cupin family protein